MTLVKKGALCDICGDLIDEPTIQPIELKGIPVVFHVHKITPQRGYGTCEDLLKMAAREKNWKLLPDCHLKEAYRAMMKSQELLNIAEKEGGEKEVLRVAGEILKNV